tara:strand:- start:910 stop:1332 length:423 start_codon:yes stop_codon:yes gene_type:complete
MCAVETAEANKQEYAKETLNMMRYTEDHEWINLNGDTGTVGISPHAIEQLGDIVFVELPEAGSTVAKGDAVAVFESVKAASDIYSPAGGEIVEVNEAMLDDLSSITPDRATESWLFKIKVDDSNELDELMDEDAYKAMIA